MAVFGTLAAAALGAVAMASPAVAAPSIQEERGHHYVEVEGISVDDNLAQGILNDLLITDTLNSLLQGGILNGYGAPAVDVDLLNHEVRTLPAQD